MNSKLKILGFLAVILLALAWVYKDVLFQGETPVLDPKELVSFTERAAFSTDDKDIGFSVMGQILSSGVSTSTVFINSCETEPFITRVSYGEKIYFKSTDSKPQVLLLRNIGRREILPDGLLVVRTTEMFGEDRKSGTYSAVSYKCEGKDGPAGFIAIVD